MEGYEDIDAEENDTEDKENNTNSDDEENNLERDREIEENSESDYEEEYITDHEQDKEENQEDEEERRPKRQRKMPVKYNDDLLEEDLENIALLTYQECMESDDKEWLKAIHEEKKCLEKNHIWKLVDEKQAKGKKIVISC